ncbi:hypothetical protein ACS0ZG_33265 [Burkholderia gladioli]|uniref:hypothetical protein n=1 Tax=Burkholderia gladioli TaxID=28095 RepID=UPI003F7B1B8B
MTHPVPGSIAPALDPGTLLPEIGARRGLAAARGACCSLVAPLPADASSCASSCASSYDSSYDSSCHSCGRSTRASSCLASHQAALRASWEHLRLIGDFQAAIRHRALRHAVEAAARLMRERALHLPLSLPCYPPRPLPLSSATTEARR